MKKSITIQYDVINQQIDIENPDDLNELEFLGLIEWAKVVMLEEMNRDD